MKIESAKDLAVYKKSYELSMRIYHLSTKWPTEEKYALTSQIRSSSRSVCANLREAWAKRRYEAHFLSKLSDCDGENSETDTWLDYARDCGYLHIDEHSQLTAEVASIGRMLGKMLTNPDAFLIRSRSGSNRSSAPNKVPQSENVMRTSDL